VITIFAALAHMSLQSTDNGAYYYYHTEGAAGRWTNASNMEPTLQGVKQYADEENIPYKYILLDSWWYPKNEQESSGGGVMTWTALPEVSRWLPFSFFVAFAIQF